MRRTNTIKKSNRNAGYTLIEMTVAVVVIVLISAAMSGGLVVATRTYRESVFQSDSAVLCDTLNTALSDVLRFAIYTQTEEGGAVLFANDQYNILSRGHIANSEGFLYIDTGGGGSEQLLLVNSGAYVGLQVTGFTLRYESATNIYEGEYLISNADGSMTRECIFTYRSLRYPT